MVFDDTSIGSGDNKADLTCNTAIPVSLRGQTPHPTRATENPGSSRTAATAEHASSSQVTIPIAEEQLDVSVKRVPTSTVKVHVRTEASDELVDLPTTTEHVEVERVAINQLVDQVPPTRQEGPTLIIPVIEEVLVVEKRLRLREEIRITTKNQITNQPQHHKLRKQKADIERVSEQTASDSR